MFPAPREIVSELQLRMEIVLCSLIELRTSAARRMNWIRHCGIPLGR